MFSAFRPTSVASSCTRWCALPRVVLLVARWWGGSAQACALLAEMEAEGLMPSTVSLNATISACERGRQWETALLLMASMPGRAIHADTVTYNAAIAACGKGERWDLALELLACMWQARSKRSDLGRVFRGARLGKPISSPIFDDPSGLRSHFRPPREGPK